MEKKKFSTRYLAEVALFVGVILVMKITGLSSIPVGPLVMTFTMIRGPTGMHSSASPV